MESVYLSSVLSTLLLYRIETISNLTVALCIYELWKGADRATVNAIIRSYTVHVYNSSIHTHVQEI